MEEKALYLWNLTKQPSERLKGSLNNKYSRERKKKKNPDYKIPNFITSNDYKKKRVLTLKRNII